MRKRISIFLLVSLFLMIFCQPLIAVADDESNISEEIETQSVESFITSLANDSYNTATTINVNSTYTDNLASYSDINWYKFTVSSPGYISLTFTHDYLESTNTYWRAYIYDSSQTELASYSFSGTTTSYTLGNIGIPSGTYYLKITNSSYSDANYKIAIKYTSSNAWETEFNDTYSEADTININSTYNGSLCNYYDVDWYKFTISEGGMHTLSFTHDYVSSGNTYWRMYLYDASVSEIETYSYEGDVISYIDNILLSPGTYYLKIVNSSYSDVNYNFKVSAHVHSFEDVVTKATLYSNGKIIKMCSCGEIDGSIIIYYPKTITLSKTSFVYSGNVQKPAVTVKGSDGKGIAASNYTLTYSSGCKNVGKYTVKITFKGNYSGNISKTFTIVPKGTSISKLTASSKGFTVKWKKQATQTSGYQIQYSTKSNFAGAKTVTVTKNSTVSKKITKLSAKKKYYVRIRTYKTVSGTKYYSSWSSAKQVTTKK